jgi:chromosome segregation ATPase
MFKKLSGEEAAKYIVLATTKWGEVANATGERRERDLSDEYWKAMLEQGSHMDRFQNTHTSAWEIIDLILGKTEDNTLQIQRELVDLQKRIPKTEAGMSLRDTLQTLLKDQKDHARKLKDYLHESPELQEKLAETKKQIRSTLDQIKQLQVPLGARIMAVFFP